MFRASPYTLASTLSLKIGGLAYFSPFPNSQNRFDVCLFKVFLGAQRLFDKLRDGGNFSHSAKGAC